MGSTATAGGAEGTSHHLQDFPLPVHSLCAKSWPRSCESWGKCCIVSGSPFLPLRTITNSWAVCLQDCSEDAGQRQGRQMSGQDTHAHPDSGTTWDLEWLPWQPRAWLTPPPSDFSSDVNSLRYSEPLDWVCSCKLARCSAHFFYSIYQNE